VFTKVVYHAVSHYGTLMKEAMPRQRVMVPYPPDVIAEIDKIVSHGKRTAFLVELAKREIKLNRQRQALRAATGAWRAEDHPELAGGAASWVREIRQESVKRFEKIQRRREAK
jgi:hypothetical protein